MEGLEIPAYAKINLSLDVLRKREDGYHELKMIMQTVELHDIIRLEVIQRSGIYIECGSRWVPPDRTNTAWKAADILLTKAGIKSGIRISINKKIPVAAGLAGGSADAAAVLRGLNKIFSLGLEHSELRGLGKLVGADVPYCIDGGTRLAEGVGECLTPLPEFKGVDIILVKPKIGVSTAWVFNNLKVQDIKEIDRPDTALLLKALEKKDHKLLAEKMKNVLELVTIPKYKIVQEAKGQLLELGALGSMMSGSGPTVFGIFPDGRTAAKAREALSSDGRWQCYLTRTTGELNNF